MKKTTNKTLLIIGTVILAAIIIFSPIPSVVLDILLLANLLFALIIFFAVFTNKKAVIFFLFPNITLLFSVICLSTFISAVRLILTRGVEFDGKVIKFASSYLTSFGIIEGLESLIAGLVTFIALITIQAYITIKLTYRLLEVNARFVLDGHASKMLKIEVDFSSGTIDQKEAKLQKESLQQQLDFYGAMEGDGRFISGAFKFGLFILSISIAGGIIIERLNHDGTIIEALKTYSILLFCACFLSYVPLCLFSIAAVNKVISYSGSKDLFKSSKKSNTEKESFVLKTIDLEIGYKLIPFTDDVKSHKFDECLDDMRQEIKHDLGFDIPILHLSNKKCFGSSRYCIKYKGEVLGKGKIKANEDPSIVITAHLMKVIKWYDLRR